MSVSVMSGYCVCSLYPYLSYLMYLLVVSAFAALPLSDLEGLREVLGARLSPSLSWGEVFLVFHVFRAVRGTAHLSWFVARRDRGVAAKEISISTLVFVFISGFFTSWHQLEPGLLSVLIVVLLVSLMMLLHIVVILMSVAMIVMLIDVVGVSITLLHFHVVLVLDQVEVDLALWLCSLLR